MKGLIRKVMAVAVVFLVASTTNLLAQQQQNQEKGKTQTPKQIQPIQHGYHFVDKDGDGYNDNAPDADGDGIPNGVDPDYQGAKNRRGGMKQNFVDENGDGINDLAGTGGAKWNKGRGRGKIGARMRGGNCDGTGPKGFRRNSTIK